ncbi:MAG: hypothetical protein IJJ38_04235 [Lachnospiraceae bacterium]|nr:hypothetical protein [Lachnospiraceae bacterium]
MKILIAVPTFETISPDTFKSIYGLDPGGHWCVFDFVRGYDCATARNNIAQQAMNEEADYVFMVDNDVVLPPDALINLLDDAKDVCLGYYPNRNLQNVYDGKTSVCRMGELNYTLQYPSLEMQALRDTGQFKIQIHGGGMGCAMIRTELFRKLSYPWFDWVNYADRGILSEDLFFCEKCGQAGIPVYTDTRVGCGHLLRRVEWPH